ncbi:Phosphatidylinositide phosphatase SAC1 [Histomonas meleagridis]|uniref:Phosphatidylinositide phosphatase SAC1 n=1 Tax=Histomonas meleagridis TaxID=135588 RepID=UPI0035593920|nr:Phosphatidylinositide phosphatase SAC1 [Histomonas meleagridis]KAH0797158.1 Phosphatidylinositide phosphatase SAC1 [Histomonas meleagridis]
MEYSLSYDSNTVLISANGKPIAGIDRKTLKQIQNPKALENCEHFDFLFLLGAYEIEDKTFIAAATQLQSVSEVWNINKITQFKILQLNEGNTDERLKSLLNEGLLLCPLYYSDTNDLSLSLQLQINGSPSRKRFTWNHKPLQILQKLIDNVYPFSKPIISGFVSTFKTKDFTLLLVSRRSPIRAGTRFWMRGCDEEGNTSNYVETEQVISLGSKLFSYVQIRGSIPVLWSQNPDLKSRLPSIYLDTPNACEIALKKHFQTLHEEYGTVLAASLTNDKGYEKPLTDMYNTLGPKCTNVSYYYFDFHRECSKMRFHNINKLIEQMSTELDSLGFTYVEEGILKQSQTGIVRTNCVDCLDRTGVLQNEVALRSLIKQLDSVGLKFECDFEFRGIWADNADEISLQYSGTKALKTDFTRTGKRTIKGALSDGVNSVQRFYINNCCDGTRQDEYDVVTQDVKCNKYVKGNGFLMILAMLFYMLMMYVITWIKEGRKQAKEKTRRIGTEAVNHPSFRKIKDYYEVKREEEK